MSRVTTVVLYIGANDPVLIAVVNGELSNLGSHDPRDRRPYFDLSDLSDGPWGGTKWPAVVYGGAFNHFDIKLLADAVCTTPWEYPDEVQAIVKGPDDSVFRILTISELQAIRTA